MIKGNPDSYQNLELENRRVACFKSKKNCHDYIKLALINPKFIKEIKSNSKEQVQKLNKYTINQGKFLKIFSLNKNT